MKVDSSSEKRALIEGRVQVVLLIWVPKITLETLAVEGNFTEPENVPEVAPLESMILL